MNTELRFFFHKFVIKNTIGRWVILWHLIFVLESGDFIHSESGEIRQSESNNKNQSPGLYLLN